MANPNNHGALVGRVSQDIREFPNNDGSKVLLLNIAVDDNFVSGPDRKAKTQFVPVRVFLGKNVQGRGAWDSVHKGDLISVSTRITAAPYEKDGEMVYPAPTIEVDGFPQFLESKKVVEERAARNAVAAAAAPAAETAAPAEDSLEAQMARLQQQIEERNAGGALDPESTSPFATAV